MQSVKNSLTIGRLAINTNKGLKFRNGKLTMSIINSAKLFIDNIKFKH